MANMSSCRFRNTQYDLTDCANALEEMDFNIEVLPDEEKSAARRLIEMCRCIVEEADARS